MKQKFLYVEEVLCKSKRLRLQKLRQNVTVVIVELASIVVVYTLGVAALSKTRWATPKIPIVLKKKSLNLEYKPSSPPVSR